MRASLTERWSGHAIGQEGEKLKFRRMSGRYIFPNTQVARLIAGGEGSARGETCFADRASIEPTDSREHAISATKVHVLNLNSFAKCPQLY